MAQLQGCIITRKRWWWRDDKWWYGHMSLKQDHWVETWRPWKDTATAVAVSSRDKANSAAVAVRSNARHTTKATKPAQKKPASARPAQKKPATAIPVKKKPASATKKIMRIDDLPDPEKGLPFSAYLPGAYHLMDATPAERRAYERWATTGSTQKQP
jgi:hypothetical protein